MAPVTQYFPIRELSTYFNRWTICARITSKGQMREFASRMVAEPGKVFTIELLDAEKGEIKASFFGHAAETWYSKLEVGKCYTFNRGSVKIANQRFNTCRHRYEIVFDKDATIVEVAEDAKIAAVSYNFVGLQAVQTRELPCTVDICGVVASFRPTFAFTSRDGKELVKREITLADDTAASVVVTLWGDRAKEADSVFDGSPTLCLKGVLVKEWNGGRSGSLLGGGAMELSPALPEVARVQKWWSSGGSTQSLSSMSPSFGGGIGGGGRISGAKAMNLAEMRKASDQVGEPEVYSIVCRLAQVQMKKQGEVQPLYYMACQEPRQGGSGFPCNKRLDASGFCASCSRTGRAAPRLNLRCRYADMEDSVWITTFHEPAQQLLNAKAEEAQALDRGEGGRDALEKLVCSRYFHGPLQVTVKANMGMFNGQPRTNISCIDARPVSLREHGRILLKEIGKMLA